jgi:hypothetical protein
MSAFIYALNSADVIRVDGGPLLTDYEYDEDDKMATFRWVDEDNQFEVVVPRDSIATAEHKANGFVVADVDGKTVTVEVFSLVPEYPVPLKWSEGWLELFKLADRENIIHDAAFQGVIDSLVDNFIGGHASCSVNNEGYLGQIEGLYASCRGQPGAIICDLAKRLSYVTPYTRAAWESVLEDPEIRESLVSTLKQQSDAA